MIEGQQWRSLAEARRCTVVVSYRESQKVCFPDLVVVDITEDTIILAALAIGQRNIWKQIDRITTGYGGN